MQSLFYEMKTVEIIAVDESNVLTISMSLLQKKADVNVLPGVIMDIWDGIWYTYV